MNKYMTNIENNPEEEKYKKIKLSNKAFTGKVATQDGSENYVSSPCGSGPFFGGNTPHLLKQCRNEIRLHR